MTIYIGFLIKPVFKFRFQTCFRFASNIFPVNIFPWFIYYYVTSGVFLKYFQFCCDRPLSSQNLAPNRRKSKKNKKIEIMIDQSIFTLNWKKTVPPDVSHVNHHELRILNLLVPYFHDTWPCRNRIWYR